MTSPDGVASIDVCGDDRDAALEEVDAKQQHESERKSWCKGFEVSHSESVRSRVGRQTSRASVASYDSSVSSSSSHARARERRQRFQEQVCSYLLTLDALLATELESRDRGRGALGRYLLASECPTDSPQLREATPGEVQPQSSKSRGEIRKCVAQCRSYLRCSPDTAQSTGNADPDVASTRDDASSYSELLLDTVGKTSMLSDLLEEVVDLGEEFDVFGSDDNENDLRLRLLEFEDYRNRQLLKQRRKRVGGKHIG
eukprot:TRINITY_DN59063_c0_g1_i1.p1 TRINITY_DN59063_c0_g1~~TRINITY_DN59063_c0_g1_i1.p1  ORF type:complete len:257 (+),score=29.26 TRINITY_DN59063_c0_g1_i1:103-873(+)